MLLTISIDQLSQVAVVTEKNSDQVVASSSSSSSHYQPFQVRNIKLDFPRFDGTNSLHWLFRAKQFFSYYDTLNNQRLTIVTVHMEGTVVPWFQMIKKAK